MPISGRHGVVAQPAAATPYIQGAGLGRHETAGPHLHRERELARDRSGGESRGSRPPAPEPAGAVPTTPGASPSARPAKIGIQIWRSGCRKRCPETGRIPIGI